MAAFANSAANDGTHTVRLMTDWGAVFAQKAADEDLFYTKSCEHGSYPPSQKLCAYLMDNTSIEFMGINVRRALRCMGQAVSGISPTDDDRLPTTARTHEILGVRVASELVLEFADSTDSRPPTLSFTAVGH